MKAYSKNAKRKNKKARGKRAMFRQIESREEARAQKIKRDDAQKTVREARVRKTGLSEREVMDAKYGEAIGYVILLEAKSKADIETLWKTYCDFDHVDHVYFSRVLNRSRFPAGAKMEFVPERVEADPDARPDLRSDEEKARNAVADWMRWQGYLGRLPGQQRSAVIRAVRQMDMVLIDEKVTPQGRFFVEALRALAGAKEAAE